VQHSSGNFSCFGRKERRIKTFTGRIKQTTIKGGTKKLKKVISPPQDFGSIYVCGQILFETFCYIHKIPHFLQRLIFVQLKAKKKRSLYEIPIPARNGALLL
jgi:hypothetical protein